IHSWEAEAVFNGCPIKKGQMTHLVYRALSLPHYHRPAGIKLMLSDIGIAESRNGIDFHNRKRLVVPEESWERFGCEDPRVTYLDGVYYIFYTALSEYPFRAEGIKVGVALSKDLKTIDEKHLVTPFNAKGMSLFPERINGKMWAILSVNTDRRPTKICLASFDAASELWSETKWQEWYKDFAAHALPLERRPDDHIEAGAPPVKTPEGWLVFYSYIQNYLSPKRLFGIEAMLLDLNDPMKVIGTTRAPLLTPEEYYERIGLVPEVVFPTGALREKDAIKLYYGAADTTVCLADIDLSCLLDKLTMKMKPARAARAKENPIIAPVPAHPWEAKATFNPGALYLNGVVHLLYRAQSHDNTSVFGYATSTDGIHIDWRAPEPIYVPRESFEMKKTPGGNSGCEDPRLTKIGKKIYMLYTAFDGKNLPRVAITSIAEDDFLGKKWEWAPPALISPPDLDDKDACVFPEKFGGKYFIIHRSGGDIDSAFSATLDFDGKTWVGEYNWIFPRPGMWDSKKVGIAAPPLKTDAGWILLYHGISNEDGNYRVGALLLDLKDPTQILARSDEPILEPEMEYEKNGLVSNVVFPCGAVLIGKKIFMYYGGADTVVGVATLDYEKLLENLNACRC
ncbi:MAG: hypothetical protein HYY60_00905, partial [Parcubacteria group bacterium]|nr:hypothetical protein [Parcubacteria group bacterium]